MIFYILAIERIVRWGINSWHLMISRGTFCFMQQGSGWIWLSSSPLSLPFSLNEIGSKFRVVFSTCDNPSRLSKTFWSCHKSWALRFLQQIWARKTGIRVRVPPVWGMKGFCLTFVFARIVPQAQLYISVTHSRCVFKGQMLFLLVLTLILLHSSLNHLKLPGGHNHGQWQ